MNNLQLHGGSPQNRKRSKSDYYPTPPECTIALLDFLKLDKTFTVWECASGEGDMSKILEKYFDNVISTDINMGIDFLHSNYECDAIITNPPFSLSTDFIKKALNDCDIVAMLFKSQFWHSKKRYDIYEKYKPSYILPLTWRPDFLFKERNVGDKASPTMEVLWTVWIKGNNNCTYQPLKKPII